jgi:hypothetical protein
VSSTEYHKDRYAKLKADPDWVEQRRYEEKWKHRMEVGTALAHRQMRAMAEEYGLLPEDKLPLTHYKAQKHYR